jgi:hypothetical protein
MSEILAQYDAQKGCRPRWLCSGDADGIPTLDEFSAALSYPLSAEVAPPIMLAILSANLPDLIPKSFLTVRQTVSHSRQNFKPSLRLNYNSRNQQLHSCN